MIVELSSSQRRVLRAAAHTLNPVVSVAQQGLSPTVLAEIEIALNSHELIKIRVYGEDRAIREALMAQICEAVSAAPVQHIGNILVIWRKKPEVEAAEPKRPRAPNLKGVRKAERVEGKTAAKSPARTSARSSTSKTPAPPSRYRTSTTRSAGAATAARRRVTTGGKGRGGR